MCTKQTRVTLYDKDTERAVNRLIHEKGISPVAILEAIFNTSNKAEQINLVNKVIYDNDLWFDW